jgi:hypothetical protein
VARRYCPASTGVSSSLKAAERGSRRMVAAPYFQRVMAHHTVPARGRRDLRTHTALSSRSTRTSSASPVTRYHQDRSARSDGRRPLSAKGTKSREGIAGGAAGYGDFRRFAERPLEATEALVVETLQASSPQTTDSGLRREPPLAKDHASRSLSTPTIAPGIQDACLHGCGRPLHESRGPTIRTRSRVAIFVPSFSVWGSLRAPAP